MRRPAYSSRHRRQTAHRAKMTCVYRSRTMAAALSATTAGVGAVYLGLVTGAVPINLGIGRTTRPLGPLSVEIAAPRDTVFDVISGP